MAAFVPRTTASFVLVVVRLLVPDHADYEHDYESRARRLPRALAWRATRIRDGLRG